MGVERAEVGIKIVAPAVTAAAKNLTERHALSFGVAVICDSAGGLNRGQVEQAMSTSSQRRPHLAQPRSVVEPTVQRQRLVLRPGFSLEREICVLRKSPFNQHGVPPA